MKMFLQRALVTSGLFFFVLSSIAADTLTWNSRSNRVDADLQGVELHTLLERIASKTGWETFVEPETKHQASTKFTNLPVEQALPRLLGKLNYALVPQTNGPSRFYVFRTRVGNATQRIGSAAKAAINNDDPSVICNQLIITLEPSSQTTIDELAKTVGAKVLGRSEELHSYLLQFKECADAAKGGEALRVRSEVASVDTNYEFGKPETPEPMANASAPGFNLHPTAVGDPNNIVVGLIDTSINGMDPSMKDFLLEAISIAGESDAKSLTHGTSMAETLLQALDTADKGKGSSTVKILPVDVYGANEQASTYHVALGINAAVNKGAMIINLSLGGTGDSPFLHRLIVEAHRQGVVFLAAAGNTPTTVHNYPSAYPEVISVTAGNAKGELASYANRSDVIDIIGPSTAVVSYNKQPFIVGGTSTATAWQTGNAAALAEALKKDFPKTESTMRDRFHFTPPPSR